MKLQDKQALLRYKEKLNAIRNGSDIPSNESHDQQRERIEKSKRDYNYFVNTYFKHYADAECADFQINLANRVKKNQKCRELVRWGRGLAKSVHCDIFIPLWLWINGENLYMVLVGNNEDKAIILLSDVQAEFEGNPMLIYDFGEQKLTGSWTDGDFSTKDGRFQGKALGMEQSPRGLRIGKKRPNLIICDDLEDKFTSKNPHRQDDVVQWIERDLLKTMDGKIRRYLHPNNDPWPRSIQNQLQKKHPKWNCDIVEAYNEVTYEPRWFQKYDPDYYREIEEEDGTLSARAEFNHKKHTKGKIFKDEMIHFRKMPPLNHMKIIFGFWDPAYTDNEDSDFNAVKVWGLHGTNFWHIKAFVLQCKMEDALRFMYDYESTIPETVVIHWRVEKQFWNEPLKRAVQDVEKEKGRSINLALHDRATQKKYDRIISMFPHYQNARIFYNEKEEANPHMQVGIDQLKGIEPGYKTKDDGPDADEYALNELSKYVRIERTGNVRTRSRSSIHEHSKNRY